MPDHPRPDHPRPDQPRRVGAGHAERHLDLGGYVLGTLDVAEAAAFEAHLATCDACQAEVAELAVVPRLLARVSPAAASPPPGLAERTMAAVERAAAAAARPTPSAVPAAPPPRGRRWLAIVAAVVLIGVAAGVVRQATRPATAVAEIQLVSADQGPESGRATVRRTAEGREVELQVQGLAPTPAGSYYECWFVGDGDTLERPNRVSAGTFTVGSDGRATVRMFSAADAARFPRMGVTLEPDDGNPARTGPKVLVSK